jgi:hypothetical protein
MLMHIDLRERPTNSVGSSCSYARGLALRAAPCQLSSQFAGKLFQR